MPAIGRSWLRLTSWRRCLVEPLRLRVLPILLMCERRTQQLDLAPCGLQLLFDVSQGHQSLVVRVSEVNGFQHRTQGQKVILNGMWFRGVAHERSRASGMGFSAFG